MCKCRRQHIADNSIIAIVCSWPSGSVKSYDVEKEEGRGKSKRNLHNGTNGANDLFFILPRVLSHFPRSNVLGSEE